MRLINNKKKEEEYNFYKTKYQKLIKIWQQNYDPRKEFINKLNFKNKIILDLGCANGHLIKKHIKDNKIYGIDIGKESLKEAKKNGFFQTKCLNLDNDKFPYNKKMFDVIFCFDVIEHVFKPEKLIKNISKVIKDGGTLYLTTHNLFRCSNPKKVSGPYLFSIKEIRTMLKKEGFKKIRIYGWSWWSTENPSIIRKIKLFIWWNLPLFAKDLYVIAKK
jgi:2-polyprenyl-3-methyl-5-hydroxy-6-metoxy-1,4-benzoquinol methylase